jgi:caffeoyl-CoA O-methyltransferase
MRFLVKATKSRKGIEVGVFTGYSALCMAEGLPEDGKLIALDINEEFTNVGLKYWKEAGVDHKIDLRLGPGVDSLNKLLEDPNEVGTYDFAYIDADKLNYPNYYELLVKLLRPGGFIMFDNILWGRRVEHEELRTKDPETRAIYETILRAMKDERVDTHTINLADGFMISYKK